MTDLWKYSGDSVKKKEGKQTYLAPDKGPKWVWHPLVLRVDVFWMSWR